MAVVDKPWDGGAGRFSDSEWERSCALDRKTSGGAMASAPPKTRCSLPYKEPNGDINKNGVREAAGRISEVSGVSDDSMNAAKARLRGAYHSIGETPPPGVGGPPAGSKSEEVDTLSELAREFGVTPGVARHRVDSIRAIFGETEAVQVRDGDSGATNGYLGTLEGHFCVFNRWTRINSMFEGRFMERIAPGACKKTFQENREGIRCLFQHGRDESVGMKPLGPIRDLQEDETGGRYEVPLLDVGYNRELLPALKEGLYGASFRFQVVQEEVNSEPPRSEHNPEGIEERTIKEMRVREFGPVTFPAYAEATAGVRSLNDWWLDLDLEMFARAHPDAYPGRLADLLVALHAVGSGNGNGNGAREEQRTETETETETATAETTTTAPPPRAPDATDRLRTTRLSDAAVRSNRIGRPEVPKWHLS